MPTFTHKLVPEDIVVHNYPQTFTLETELSTNECLTIFSDLLKHFIFEIYALKNYSQMHGFLHTNLGQESIYAGLQHALFRLNIQNEFLFIGSYRCHSLCYLSGSNWFEIACELLGKKSGLSRGRAGSMHLFSKKMFGGHGIVGAQCALSIGLGLGLKFMQENKLSEDGVEYLDLKNNTYKCTDFLKYKDCKAVFVFLGDGATNQGQLYESYNLAIVHKLPVIFVIENNEKGMWTDTKSVSDTDEYFRRWLMMPGIRITSDHVLVVSCVFEQILRHRNFPVCVQIDTKRICEHSVKDEKNGFENVNLREYAKNTRLAEFESLLVDGGCKEDVEFLWENVEKEIRECWHKAVEEEAPDENELLRCA